MRTSSAAPRRSGSSASCWALLKRWISSRNRIVPWPCSPRRLAGPLDHLAHVLHAGASPRLSCSKALLVASAMSRARVVLPGARRAPEDHADARRSASIRARSGRPGAEEVRPGRRPRRGCGAAGGRPAAPGGRAARRRPRRTGRRSPAGPYPSPSRTRPSAPPARHGPDRRPPPARLALERWATSGRSTRRSRPSAAQGSRAMGGFATLGRADVDPSLLGPGRPAATISASVIPSCMRRTCQPSSTSSLPLARSPSKLDRKRW